MFESAGNLPSIRQSLGSIVEAAMVIAKVDTAMQANCRSDRDIGFIEHFEHKLAELAKKVNREKTEILQDFKSHAKETDIPCPDLSFPECDWELGIGRLIVDMFAKYFAPPGESPSLPPMLRRKSSIPQYEVISISCEPRKSRPARILKPDRAKQLKQNFTFELVKVEAPFNIAYCVTQFGKRHLLFGTKNQAKKQDLFKFSIDSQTFTKIMPVGLIMDVVCLGQFVMIAERNEDIKLFKDELLIMTLSEVFKPHYYQNQCANDSRILHIYEDKKLYYVTSSDYVVEYDVASVFTSKIIRPEKRGQLECICIHRHSLICLSQTGDVIRYSIHDGQESGRANLETEKFSYTTVASLGDYLVVSAFNTEKSENLVTLLDPDTLQVVSTFSKKNHRYPYHTIRVLPDHETFACVYRDATSQITIFTRMDKRLTLIADISLSNSMLYDVAVVDGSLYACQWLTTNSLTKVAIEYE